MLEEEVDTLYAGQEPHYGLLLDIVGYLRDYSDAVHHPREEAAFRRLARRCPDLQPAIARLQQEHRVIAQAGERLRELVEEAAADGVVPRADIETAAATYIVYYRRHIAAEDEEILPAAGRELTEEDWAAARNAAPAHAGAESIESVNERFKHLRRRIWAEAGESAAHATGLAHGLHAQTSRPEGL